MCQRFLRGVLVSIICRDQIRFLPIVIFFLVFSTLLTSTVVAQDQYVAGDHIRFRFMDKELTGTIARTMPVADACMVDIDPGNDASIPPVTMVLSGDILGRVEAADNGPKLPAIKNRIWKTADEKFSVTAELVDLDEKEVTLRKKENSKEIKVPFEKLSPKDHLYLKPFVEAKAAIKAAEAAKPKSTDAVTATGSKPEENTAVADDPFSRIGELADKVNNAQTDSERQSAIQDLQKQQMAAVEKMASDDGIDFGDDFSNDEPGSGDRPASGGSASGGRANDLASSGENSVAVDSKSASREASVSNTPKIDVASEVITDKTFGFKFEAPAGFSVAPTEANNPDSIHVLVDNTTNDGDLPNLILIERLRGTITPNNRISQREFDQVSQNQLRGIDIELESVTWNGTTLDSFRRTERQQFGRVTGFSVQFPLEGEAIQLTVTGASHRESQLRRLFKESVKSFTATNGLHGDKELRRLSNEERLKRAGSGLLRMAIAGLVLFVLVSGIVGFVVTKLKKNPKTPQRGRRPVGKKRR